MRQPPQPPAAFRFRDVHIRTMADGVAVCGSWEAFCDQIASVARVGMGDFEASKLLDHVAALVPEELRDEHCMNMQARLFMRRA